MSNSIASMLLEVKAIKLRPQSPFTWSSGWKSPIYCDNRLTLSYPAVRTYIKQELAGLIREKYPEAEVVAGVATAGIPQGALVADLLDLPYVYVRDKAKGHGMGNRIEGELKAGQKVVLVEDLISTGGSSLKAAEGLREAGAEVLGMAAIFTYGFSVAEQNFQNAGTSLACLSNYADMIAVALEQGYVGQEDVELLKAWREDPANWG
ncbi:MAG: orotate phosphoribosyltransferase [Cytophagales bacterium]|nr:orotate phosphoribosyltransferase [Cytophagales bacterium]